MKGSQREIKWNKSSLTQCAERYAILVQKICAYPEAIKEISNVLDPGDYDNFARTLVSISTPCAATIKLVIALLDLEFEKGATNPGTIMRGNTVATKMQTAFSRTVGSKYLSKVVGNLVINVANNPASLNVEVDPAKIVGADKAAVVAKNQSNLMKLASDFLSAILSDDSLGTMPRELRCLAWYICKLASKYPVDQQVSLVGGYIMLRFFNPAILAPEGYNLLPPDLSMSPTGRRALVLVTKMLQNLSNMQEFLVGNKEAYMVEMNSFILENKDRMTAYLQQIATDPNGSGFSDLLASEPLPFDIRDINIHDLISLHRVAHSNKDKALKAARMNPNYATLSKGFFDFLETMGPVNKNKQPVFYLIVNRITAPMLDNYAVFVQHVKAVMGNAINAKYAICVDMSWARVTQEMQKSVINQITGFPREQRKNIATLYVVHPTTFTKSILFVMRGLSRKIGNKIQELHSWEQLEDFIAMENISLPEDSRDFITKAFNVLKENRKGKRQERLIKFTANSLLNIDPKSKVLKNERLLSEIEEIVISPNDEKITIRFETAKVEATNAKGSLLAKMKSFTEDVNDENTRIYVCKSVQERDDILLDIFNCAFNLGTVTGPQTFNVVKVNGVGKHQERIFKLTQDSLLNLNSNNEIRSEISFAGIENVFMDETSPDVMWMKFKSEQKPRKIISALADKMTKAIQQALKRFRNEVDSEEQREKLDITGV